MYSVPAKGLPKCHEGCSPVVGHVLIQWFGMATKNADYYEVLGVPRTTVTDWLVRYSSYIDYKIQGKRKV